MITSKWCNENINAEPIRWSMVKSEIKELLTAKNFAEVKEELSDCIYMTLCAIHTYTRISIPMVGAIHTICKAKNRMKVWEKIFTENGLVFNKRYLVNGSNYLKQEKITKALALAIAEQRN